MDIRDKVGPSRTALHIIKKGERITGKVVVAYPERGHAERRTYLQAWNWENPVGEMASPLLHAGGYGYDKTQHMMERLLRQGFFGDAIDTNRDWEAVLRDRGYDVVQVL